MTTSIIAQLDTFGPTSCPSVSVSQAQRYTRRLTRAHGENFSVLTPLVPRHLRQPMADIYAFCRWADDLADQTGDRERSIELLQWWRDELHRALDATPRHPVFVALQPTITRLSLPGQPFHDLIDAFIQDQHVTEYERWDVLLDYCHRSANPVGRLMLHLTGISTSQTRALSDATCTALQLTNFWQDVRRDWLERGRVYIPRDVAQLYNFDPSRLPELIGQRTDSRPKRHESTTAPHTDLVCQRPRHQLKATVRDLVDRTWPMFHQGRELWPHVPRSMQPTIRLFTLGGEGVLKKIEKQQYDTTRHRPRLSRLEKLMLIGLVLPRRLY